MGLVRGVQVLVVLLSIFWTSSARAAAVEPRVGESYSICRVLNRERECVEVTDSCAELRKVFDATAKDVAALQKSEKPPRRSFASFCDRFELTAGHDEPLVACIGQQHRAAKLLFDLFKQAGGSCD